jgi:tetratricopeptide (TPR) repeat protein
MKSTRLVLALATTGMITATGFDDGSPVAGWFDPVLQPGAFCGSSDGKQPPLLHDLIRVAKTETAPFQPVPPKPALGEKPVLYGNLGKLSFPVSSKVPKVQAWFDQGVVLAFGFNHAEAQRAFREAQKLDPDCAICHWGEALVLGPNINVPMMPQAQEPALAALARAVALAPKANAKERALIAALEKRYSADPKAERPALDQAFAAAMKEVAAKYPADDTVQVLYAESVMDTQPWDYWEAGGAKPKGNAGEIVTTLERVLKRNPRHPGAVHLYIHAVEASSRPERSLPTARHLGELVPGAGHLVHMPAHIYYRLGMYRESLEANKRAIRVDERYFTTSPSDPLYKVAYYPHNIHFVMVSAQMGGDGKTAVDAAGKLDASIPNEVAKQFAILQPVKAAPYTTHAQFSDAKAILALPAASPDLALVQAMYHYSRAIAYAQMKDAAGAKAEIAALEKMEKERDFKEFADWQVPAKEIVQTARFVATGRLADAMGDLDGAAKAYEDAIFIEDTLSYMEPNYWYFPVRQSLAAVRLRQGKLDEAEKAFRESLARVRNNGWALAGLAETYKRQGNARAERATRAAMAKAWFGDKAGPDLARL